MILNFISLSSQTVDAVEQATSDTEAAIRHFLSSGWFHLSLSLIIACILTFIICKLTHRLPERLPLQLSSFIRKGLCAIVWAFALVQGLRAVGVDLISILGAAGVAGVAIGFAAQTTLSNIISGLFIMGERSIRIGDYIRVIGVEGSVEAVNLLSISLRQSDNSLVRIPCESIIKNPVVNVTGDELRRCDFDLGVDYDSNLEHVREVILRLVEAEPQLATNPAPVILFTGFGDSSLDLHIGAWCKTGDYHSVRFKFANNLLNEFRREGINIPFPTRTVFSCQQNEKISQN
ncbi:MAG: mechanosensitive ion channel family protein [Akkermansia sp.]|nr:mechanosensitive ion channel family protein [Akkermansia sp.]